MQMKLLGIYQCGFQCNRSTSDKIFYIHQIPGKKCEYSGREHQLYTDFKKAYVSVRKQVLYNTSLSLNTQEPSWAN
jgi:hypothetical protein